MATSERISAGKRLARQAGYFIREHSERKFSLEEIAGALFVNSSYLSRVFKCETGRTLLWYHNAVRCEKAKKLLAESELSVAKVGSAVGFVSPAHFSHMFRKMTGISPAAWRKNPEDSRPDTLRLPLPEEQNTL